MRLRGHAALAVLACVVVPAASRLAGSGKLGWTMFSRTESYRLAITGMKASGARGPVAPTSLAAAAARGPVARYLAGADRWRTIEAGSLLRDHLPELAALACRTGPFVAIDIELSVRADLDAPVETSRGHADCPR